MNLKELRLESGLKSKKVAEIMGITRQQLNAIEKGKYKIGKLKLEKFSKLYGKSEDEILNAWAKGCGHNE